MPVEQPVRNRWKRLSRALSVVVVIAGAVRIAAAFEVGVFRSIPYGSAGSHGKARITTRIPCSCAPANTALVTVAAFGIGLLMDYLVTRES